MKLTIDELMLIRNLVNANAGHYQARVLDKQQVHHRERCKEILEREQVLLTKLDMIIEKRNKAAGLSHE